MATQDIQEHEIEEDEDGTQFVRIPVDQAKDLRKIAREREQHAAAAADGEKAKRELAFLKAGVNPDTPLGSMFARGYDGELTGEAIKAAAAEIPGLLTPAEETKDETTDTTPHPDAEATRQRQQLTHGGAADLGNLDAPGQQVADEVVKKLQGENRREDQAIAAGIATIATAAINGDKSVLVGQRERLA